MTETEGRQCCPVGRGRLCGCRTLYLQRLLLLFVVFYLSQLLTTEPILLAREEVAPTDGFRASQGWLGHWF